MRLFYVIFFIVILFLGIRDVVVNRFFVVLNLFSIVLKILKKWEREVGIVVEEVLYFLCYDVIEYEKSWYIYLEFEI